MASRSLYQVGRRPHVVSVYERSSDSPLYLRFFDPKANGGQGAYQRQSLHHRNRREAEKTARQLASQLERGALTHLPTVGDVLDLYRHHELPNHKPATLKWLRQHLELWERLLGRQSRVDALGPKEWDAFKRERLSGAIDGRGHPVAEGRRQAVSPGTVNLGLDTIMMAFNWASRWRAGDHRLLQRNPFARLPYLKHVNPQRAVWTWDRFQALLQAAEALTMQVEWSGHRAQVPCPLADILILIEGTGRRIGAVRQLRAEDLRLDQGDHGMICWPADTDKTGKEWLIPITPEVRERLLRLLRTRPAFGYLFPSPRDETQPIGRDTLALFLRRAEQAAGLPRLPQDSFHGLRRKWAIERKHHPEADVAKAGGWRSVAVMKRCYQLADDAGVLQAVFHPQRLRAAGVS